MMSRTARFLVLSLLLFPAAAGAAEGFAKWEDGDTNLFIGNLSFFWASTVADAANEWNDETVFRFRIKGNGYPACDRTNSGVLNTPDEQALMNGVEFNEKMCFDVPFDANTLAVVQAISGDDGLLSTVGMIFNDAWSWEVYSGPLWVDSKIDFRRVALHELGHFMGLDHEADAVAIMNPIISDIDELQPVDIASANALYAAEPEVPEEAPEPLELCRMRQLQEASKLCKRQLACESKLAKGGDAASRDACVATAESRFVAGWNAAVASGADAGGCYEPADGSSMAPLVTSAAAAASAEVGAADAANDTDQGLRSKLLKQAATLCAADLAAWRREARSSDPEKLSRGLDKARGRFVAAGAKAIDKAAGRGVSYDGGSPDVVADALELMANQLGGVTGP
jgi:hypothetical protein